MLVGIWADNTSFPNPVIWLQAKLHMCDDCSPDAAFAVTDDRMRWRALPAVLWSAAMSKPILLHKKINAKHALILREPVISRFFQLPDKASTLKSRPVYVKVPISISTYDFFIREKALSTLFWNFQILSRAVRRERQCFSRIWGSDKKQSCKTRHQREFVFEWRWHIDFTAE